MTLSFDQNVFIQEKWKIKKKNYKKCIKITGAVNKNTILNKMFSKK